MYTVIFFLRPRETYKPVTDEHVYLQSEAVYDEVYEPAQESRGVAVDLPTEAVYDEVDTALGTQQSPGDIQMESNICYGNIGGIELDGQNRQLGTRT